MRVVSIQVVTEDLHEGDYVQSEESSHGWDHLIIFHWRMSKGRENESFKGWKENQVCCVIEAKVSMFQE